MASFYHPFGVAVTNTGNVYVADTFNYRIQKFKSDGTYLTQWGTYGSGNGQFTLPYGEALDNAGNLYVVDTRGYRVEIFAPDGT